GAAALQTRRGTQLEFFPPRRSATGGPPQRRSGRGADGARPWLLPLVSQPPAWLRQGQAETTVPPLRGNRRGGRGPGGSPGDPLRQALAQSALAGSGPGPGQPSGPLAPKPSDQLHLSLIKTKIVSY